MKSQWDASFLKNAFTEQFSSNDFWHAFAFWDHRRNWDDKDMAAIISGDFAPDLDVLIRKLAGTASHSTNLQTV
jgi:hypothetical protein